MKLHIFHLLHYYSSRGFHKVEGDLERNLRVCIKLKSLYVCLIITVKRQDKSVTNFAHRSNIGPFFFFLWKSYQKDRRYLR